MPTSMQFDKRGLQIQLDICKLVFDGDTDLLVEDRLLKEQICHRMMMLESCLRELEPWKKRNDRKTLEFTRPLWKNWTQILNVWRRCR